MPKKTPSSEKPDNRPNAAGKKSGAPVKAKGEAREARLAEALRENLRRRKENVAGEKTKDE